MRCCLALKVVPDHRDAVLAAVVPSISRKPLKAEDDNAATSPSSQMQRSISTDFMPAAGKFAIEWMAMELNCLRSVSKSAMKLKSLLNRCIV